MPIIKLLIIILLSFIAIKTGTFVGYLFITLAILYYVVSIIRWFKRITKDNDGNYIINY